MLFSAAFFPVLKMKRVQKEKRNGKKESGEKNGKRKDG